ncbi:MAG TPA: hypothetical protein VFJ94_10715 [Intrasporangium sp.]|uniref:hypothetical protein n=1 Tax=Intrasporangium sp. TaxID=1925024 RepID=UPI002D79E195|nr:hypothetical protein [Intrasporangium sp.]HET7398982.1 hypothetical protein [Intrasporangium sp.]
MADAPTLEQVARLEDTLELMHEALIDAQMAADEAGWTKIGSDDAALLSREELRKAANLARVMSVADPLISRAVNLRVAYVWGRGVTIQARQEDGAEQDLNAVVQAFLDDPSNQATFTSGQAREELERRLATGGQAFHALVTSPLSGRVQVRVIPAREVDEIICNPEDSAEPWFYKRTYTRTMVEAGYAGTRTRRETRTVYYPAVGYWPKVRPSTVDGRPVEWDKPVLHTVVNRPEDSQWGIGDVYAALPWARGYKEFLEDWAKLVKALSRFAFRATAKNRAGAAAVRSRLSAAPVTGDGSVGGTVVTGEGQAFEAIGKSGATIDSQSGRPLAAMVAAATDVPVTMLLADPGVTGARATAETLDEPLRLIIEMRRDLHADLIRKVLGYVIDQAVKAPQGPLKGRITRDPVTGREVVALAGEQDRGIDVVWPDLSKDSLETLVKAIVEADGTEILPPLVIAQLLLAALDVDNADEVLAGLVGADGNFVWPRDAQAARSQQDAVAAGTVPPAA